MPDTPVEVARRILRSWPEESTTPLAVAEVMQARLYRPGTAPWRILDEDRRPTGSRRSAHRRRGTTMEPMNATRTVEEHRDEVLD
ncbi:MAG TPA: hypothetical protein VFC48_10125, partial [Cellulomonas sp.]|nr:hypothetical protein [Cellulomonas sp.]